MMILLLIGIFMTELVKYGVWFKSIHSLRFKRLGVGFVLAGVFAALIVAGVVNENTALLVWNLTAVIVCTISLECDKGERGLLALQAAFVVIGMDEIVGGALKLIKKLPLQNAVLNKESYIQSNIIIIILFLLIGIIIRKRKGSIKVSRTHSKLINIIIVIMSAAIFLVITGFQSISQYYVEGGIKLFSRIISIISFVCIGCFAMIINYVFNENKRYKLFLEQEELLLKTQKNIYDTMLTKNEKIRSFQHDVKNHFIYLNELAQNGDVSKIREYLNGIENHLGSIDKRVYLVGNSVVDAVLNYYLPLLDEDVEVKVDGVCTAKVKISEVELCTVVSNLVQNAIEALQGMQGGERYFKIELGSGKNHMVMRIKNTYSGAKIILDERRNIPKTSKNNVEEHGIGLRNVKETVEKNGGIFTMDIKDKEFEVSIMLPLENAAGM